MQRTTTFILALGLLAAVPAIPAFGYADEASAAAPVSCGNGVPGGINCVATKAQTKEARTAFVRGLKLAEHKRTEEAYAEFDKAVRLVPQNPQFLNARELLKAQLVYRHLERGNLLLLANSLPAATAEFRAALDLDPENPSVWERLKETEREAAPDPPAAVPPLLADAGEIHVQPRVQSATFHYTGDLHGLFGALAPAFGVSVQFDESVKNPQVVFNVDNVDFLAAVKLACQTTRTMWTALDEHQIYVAADTPENHKQFDRLSLETFRLPPHSSPTEVQEIVNTLRTMFDLRFISQGQMADTIEIRGPQPYLAACEKLLAQFDHGRPQVVLDLRIFQISHQLMRNIGAHAPNTFNLYNIPTAALAGLAGQNIQQLINQIIASGGINQAGSSSLSSILSQLQGQQNSIFSQPLATFGGGLTFMGLSLDHLATALSVNESWGRTLEHVTVRTDQSTSEASFHVGERYPILNASYAPIYNSPQISQVLGNQSYIPPIPSVSYEDIGLVIKAKTAVHGDRSVSLQLDVEVRSLTGQTNNGVPVLANQQYSGSINVRDGEPAVVTGQISRTEQMAIEGIPGLGFLPGLNQIAASNTKQIDEDELLMVITPHVTTDVRRTTPEIWITER